jgi:hypothetical protein
VQRSRIGAMEHDFDSDRSAMTRESISQGSRISCGSAPRRWRTWRLDRISVRTSRMKCKWWNSLGPPKVR